MVVWILKYTGCIVCECKLTEVIVKHTNTLCTSLKRKYTKNEINTAQHSAKWHHNLTARSKSLCSNQPPTYSRALLRSMATAEIPSMLWKLKIHDCNQLSISQTHQSISCPALLLLRFILTSSQICLHLPSGISLGFPTKFPFCPKNAVYHTQLNLPDILTLMIVGAREMNKFWLVRWDESFHSFTEFGRYHHHHQWILNHCIQVALYYKLSLQRLCTCKPKATAHQSSSIILPFVINWH